VPLGLDAQRALTAILRERAHQLPRRVAPRLGAAARLLPALLHASFGERPLELDAPGVAGLRYRRRWSSLAHAFGLPPPCRAQRERPLIDSVLALPVAGTLTAYAIVPAGLADESRRVVRDRLEAIQKIFTAAGAPVSATVLEPAQLAQDQETCHRLMAFGALLAGHLSPAAWDAWESSRRPMAQLSTSALAASAPAPLATLALTLLARAPCPGPLEAALMLLTRGMEPRHLADPEVFCLNWAGLVPELAGLLAEAALLSSSSVAQADLRRLIANGRALAHACAAAIRASGIGRINRFTQRLWREALGPVIPRFLLPAIGDRLGAEAAAGKLRLDPMRVGHGYEVLLRDGTLLGRGASPVQARLRALSLVAAADAERPPGQGSSLLSGLDPTWREVGHRLGRKRESASLLLVVVAGGGTRPGPPMDLLNRGLERVLEFDGALSVLLVPGKRPSGRMLSPDQAVRTILARAPAGASLEVLGQGAARPVATRLAQIAALLRDPTARAPIAIEAGGRVLVPTGSRVFDYPLRRFAARPRHFTADPDAPDISISAGERRGLRWLPAGMVQCRVLLIDANSAALLYADEHGAYLREEAPVAEVEERLREAREIVREAVPPAVLAVRLSDALEPAIRRAGPSIAASRVAVCGTISSLEVEIEGERFGGKSKLGWRDAAEALLALWPTGEGQGVVGIGAVTTSARGKGLSPILALYAASVARRRLRTHLARAMEAYRMAAASRREG